MQKRWKFGTAFIGALISSQLSAATDCASGSHVADAQVVPAASIGAVLRATQFAWDGGNRIVHVCDLNAEDGDFLSYWSLYSREVDGAFNGICIQLTGTDGRDWYSCATEQAVARAFASPIGSTASRLHFDEWQRGISANIQR